MKFTFKIGLILSIIVALVADIVLVTRVGFTGGLLGIISITTMTPIIAMSVHFMVNRTGHRFVNGPDWTKMTPEQIQWALKRVGFVLTASMIPMCWSIVLIALPDIGLIAFAVLLSLSLILLVAGLVVSLRKPPEIVRNTPMTELNKWLVFIVAMALAAVPTAVITIEGDVADSITIDFMEDRVKVKGPMFDHEFLYSEIAFEDCVLDDDFDRGSRRVGYSTGSIESGKYRNSLLGNYELSSYTSCDSCIVIKVGGSYYAFNQKTEERTSELYAELCSRIASS